MSAASAGLMQGTGTNLEISIIPSEAKGFMDHFQREALRTGIGMAASIAGGMDRLSNLPTHDFKK